MIHMKIGHHFGKRKPRWNFFTDQYQSLVDNSSTLIFKVFAVSIFAQIVFLLPALYWIFQNYSIIQTLMPASFNMNENIEFEKKWIVFLALASTFATSLVNAYLWLYVYKINSKSYPVIRDHVVSHDEAVDRHLAS